MGEHAAQFVVVQRFHDAGGHGDSRVLGIASRRERVRRPRMDHADLRHRKLGLLREFLDETEELRRLRTGNLLGTVRGEHHLVAVPIRNEIHPEGKDEHDDHALLAAEAASDDDKQRGQKRHQDRGLECVHDGSETSLYSMNKK